MGIHKLSRTCCFDEANVRFIEENRGPLSFSAYVNHVVSTYRISDELRSIEHVNAAVQQVLSVLQNSKHETENASGYEPQKAKAAKLCDISQEKSA